MKYENVDRAGVIKLTIEQHERLIKQLQAGDVRILIDNKGPNDAPLWKIEVHNSETTSPYRKSFLNFIQDAVDFHKDEINKLLEEIKTL